MLFGKFGADMPNHVIWFRLDVTISLGEVVTLHNGSINEMVKLVLQQVQIPLDKVRVDHSH